MVIYLGTSQTCHRAGAESEYGDYDYKSRIVLTLIDLRGLGKYDCGVIYIKYVLS